MKPLMVFTDPVHDVALEILGPHFRIVSADRLRADQTVLREADAVINRAFKMSAAVLESCRSLKVIAKHGAGIDNIDIATADALGIVVANVPGGNAKAVAEATVALMLAAIWRVPHAHAMVAAGQFHRRWELHFEQLTERILGLVGLGSIGARVARICSAGFEMDVIAYDPMVDDARMVELGVRRADNLDRLLETADIVSLHVPLTPETHHMIGPRELRMMKNTAVLVNAARGKLVDGAALHRALDEGQIHAAGLDVFEVEPPAVDDPLLQLSNVVLSPHTAASTIEVEKYMAKASAESVLDVLRGRRPATTVNPHVWNKRRMQAAV